MSDTAKPKTAGDKLSADEVNNDLPIPMTAGETINGATLPVAIYIYDTDNEVYACDANDTAKLYFIGFAITNSTDGNGITIQTKGIVSGFTGLDAGKKYYVQDDKTIGTSVGTYEVLVGIAISATQLLIFTRELTQKAQTITGIKTFGSIPVLPASDPTTDNQATRKSYVMKIISGTYTGDGTDDRAITHGLGRTPQLVMIQETGDTIHHKIFMIMNTHMSKIADDADIEDVTTATNTYFYLGGFGSNTDGDSYSWTAMG